MAKVNDLLVQGLLKIAGKIEHPILTKLIDLQLDKYCKTYVNNNAVHLAVKLGNYNAGIAIRESDNGTCYVGTSAANSDGFSTYIMINGTGTIQFVSSHGTHDIITSRTFTASDYALANHIHSQYSPTSHNHDGVYIKPDGVSVYNTLYMSNWFRAKGASGILFEDHGGGIHMTDTSFVRVYGSKKLFVQEDMISGKNVIGFYSDERLKKNFTEINSALTTIMSVDPYYYEQNELAEKFGYNDYGKIQIGFKAQEIEKILPSVIHESGCNLNPNLTKDIQELIKKDPIKTIDYSKLTPLLWKGIQELTAKTERLEKIISKLGGVK